MTRQVAALDSTEKGHTGLASYYSERGEQPGQWVGSGMASIEGLNVGDAVTAEQMRALFGAGMHPLAAQRQAQLQGPALHEADYQAVMRLGVPFPVHDSDVSPFRLEVAKRLAAVHEAAGLPSDRPATPEERARIRTEVAREFFRAEHGRDPVDARELAGQIAKDSKPRTQAVAGYDLTFSPVKSVSTLWAVADPQVAAVIERAHQAAVNDALTFIEQHALFTRTGAQGVLAPTRELVAELNQRARTHRLTGNEAGPAVRVADGNEASVGDVIITRTNDRRLRVSGKDWVKNGDRWTVTAVNRDGGLTVRHNRSHRTTRLPAGYVQTSTGLGYATTIHGAQGISCDTMHGLACGQETRQQLYTMLTRGRTANHLYLQVVGDGDPHSLIRPETVTPRTPTDILEQILARDDTPTSATTVLRDLTDPATRLYEATQRYADSLRAAAEHTLGRDIVGALDTYADRVVPGLTEELAWPTLRAHLLHLAAGTGEHPLLQLQIVATGRQLDTSTDKAALLDWRLEGLDLHLAGLPWLPGIPPPMHDHPEWGLYLSQRAQLVADLAQQVRDRAATDTTPPVWAPADSRPISSATLGDVAVWRAATGVSPQDRRPTGPEQLRTAANLWQRRLDRQVQHSSDETPEHNTERSRTWSRTPTPDRHPHDHYRPDRSGPFGRSR